LFGPPTSGLSEHLSLELDQQRVHGALHHGGKITAWVLVPEQVLRAFDLVFEHAARRELNLVACFRKGVDSAAGLAWP
jgi:hypothetical protein